MTEQERIAFKDIKRAIKAKGHKVSDVPMKELRAMVKALVIERAIDNGYHD